MCDLEKQTEYDTIWGGIGDTSIWQLYPLDDDRYIATCFDNILRVYNINTGNESIYLDLCNLVLMLLSYVFFLNFVYKARLNLMIAVQV